MTDDHTITSDDALPAAATTKLAELKDLACAAAARWNDGDRKGALDAIGAAIPAAAAAATALNILLELDRAAEQARAKEHGPHDGVTRRWG
ncbi:hypothetical protein [Kitasatospora sp. NPDC085879]|jgi:hypothetical protein|uniref:hypothetical protein n=1 Tax=Kitasatospora sp. NPDC085879 TaxID=3154769 RepID=UPI00343D6A86